MGYSFFSQLWNSKRFFPTLQLSIMLIAIVPLVLVQQFAKNMIEEISRRVIEISAGHIQVVLNKDTQQFEKAQKAKKTVAETPFIQSAFLEIGGAGILRKGTRRTGVQIRGVEEGVFTEKQFSQYIRILEGNINLGEDRAIIIGESIAEDLQAKVGDELLLLTVQTNTAQLPPKITRFTVKAVVSTGYKELDRSWIFVPLSVAQSIVPPTQQIWVVNAKIEDPFILPNKIRKVSQKQQNKGIDILRQMYTQLEPYGFVYTWYDNNRAQFNLFASTNRLLTLVMFVAILLATITLSSIMGLRVIDLETEIALLKSMGADPYKLERSLLYQGFYCGVISAVLGSVMGIFLSMGAQQIVSGIDYVINFVRTMFGNTNTISLLSGDYYIQNMGFSIYYRELFTVMGCTIVLSMAAAYLPVRKLRNIEAKKILRLH